jgi:hypothetical protein
MSDLYNKVKKNVLGSKDLEAINQLDVMEGKTSSGKGHFDTKEGSVRHVYVTKDVPTSETSTFVKRRMKMAGLDTLKKVPGPIGKAAAAGALAGVALEKGINKLKSMKEKDAESEPTASDVEGKKKGGMTKGQKKVGRVMREFKKGELHSGKKGPVVKNPKQAIAIALSEAGMSKPQKKQAGGMIRFRKQYQMHNGKF